MEGYGDPPGEATGVRPRPGRPWPGLAWVDFQLGLLLRLCQKRTSRSTVERSCALAVFGTHWQGWRYLNLNHWYNRESPPPLIPMT